VTIFRRAILNRGVELYLCTSSRDLTPNLNTLESCLTSLHAWFCHNGLSLNSGKSESILFGTSTRLRDRNFPPLTGANIAGTVASLSQTKLLPLESPSTVILPCLTTSQTSVDLHIITSGHCVISGRFQAVSHR